MLRRARLLGLELAGSILAAPQRERLRTAAALTEAGARVHIDVMTGEYRGQPGVEPSEVAPLARLVGARMDVHLMSERCAEAWETLAVDRVSRLMIQARSVEEAEQARSIGAADARWIAIDPAVWSPEPESLKEWDGVLVMLTPPGQPGHAADLGWLRYAADLAEQTTVGVDGGVTPAALEEIASAGVSHVVAGRALMLTGSS